MLLSLYRFRVCDWVNHVGPTEAVDRGGDFRQLAAWNLHLASY